MTIPSKSNDPLPIISDSMDPNDPTSILYDPSLLDRKKDVSVDKSADNSIAKVGGAGGSSVPPTGIVLPEEPDMKPKSVHRQHRGLKNIEKIT